MYNGYFTLDALVSLIILFSILTAIPIIHPNIDTAMVYKEVSDLTNVVIITRTYNNPFTLKPLIHSTYPNIGLVIDGQRIISSSGHNTIRIIRPVFERGSMREVLFVVNY